MKLRIITPITTTGLGASIDISPSCESDTELSFYVQIEYGPASIECDYDEMLATPGFRQWRATSRRSGTAWTL